jgi:hypothetical protein
MQIAHRWHQPDACALPLPAPGQPLHGRDAMETRPTPRKSEQEFAHYSLVCAAEGPQKIHVQRDLVIQKSYFHPGQYAALKAFYDLVRAIDEEQIVLVREKKQAISPAP